MNFRLQAAAAALLVAGVATAAQAMPRSPLLSMSRDQMRGEVERRYDAAVKLTLDPATINSRNENYFWASEAKVACGIAIGFLKTGTVDEDSVDRCDEFARRMTLPPPPPPAPPPPPPVAAAPPPAACQPDKPMVLYFDWNVDTPTPETQAVISQIAQNYANCGWSGLSVVGHADRSGPDAYNMRLSVRRANNVAAGLAAAGVPAANITVEGRGERDPAVPTPDGVREPLNRRADVSPVRR